MPRNVTMAQPRSRVVGLEGYDQVSGPRQHRRVPARWIAGVQRGIGRRIGARAGGQLPEVMAVEMDGMWDRQRRLDYQVVPFVCCCQLDHGIAVGERGRFVGR